MSNLYETGKMCLRYLVPFTYDGDFEEACNKIESWNGKTAESEEGNQAKTEADNQKKSESENRAEAKTKDKKKYWEKRQLTKDDAESDLYQYIREEFRTAEEEKENTKSDKAGCEWLLYRSEEAKEKDGKPIVELRYFPERLTTKDDIEKAWKVKVVNVGLLLFRNGLGMLWYEMRLPDRAVITSKQLVDFQNMVRELNRKEIPSFWEVVSNREPEQGIVISEKKGHKNYISPFSMGEWIQDTIGFLQVKYFAERKSAMKKMNTEAMKQAKLLADVEVIDKKSVHTADKRQNDAAESRMTADKAILFTYASFRKTSAFDTEEDRINLLFHLTNGYNENYHCSKETAKDVKQPFDDVFWYATQEGAAYLAWPSQDNRATFENVIPSKIRTDYFALYLKTLYQSYSLLIYADKIQRMIPASLEEYKKTASKSEIGNLNAEINLFLAKSMATSVSHIHHQSEFYVYLQERLRILENINSVTAGLNALESLQREQLREQEHKRECDEQNRLKEQERREKKREEREKQSDDQIQAILGLFALLGVASALVDGFEVVKLFAGNEGWKMLNIGPIVVAVIIWAVILAISGVAGYFAVKAIRKAFGFGKGKEKKAKKKKSPEPKKESSLEKVELP